MTRDTLAPGSGEALARTALFWSVAALLCCGVLLGPYAIYRAMQALQALGPAPATGRGRAALALALAVVAFLAWLFFVLPLVLLVVFTQGTAIPSFIHTLF